MRRSALIALALSAAFAAAPAAASATPPRTAPQGFIGVNMDPWQLISANVNIQSEMAVAAKSGVESIRLPVYWNQIQPNSADNFDWTNLDSVVTAAAHSGIQLNPTLLSAPRWAQDSAYRDQCKTTSAYMPIPRDFNQFATFAASLAARYGTGGTFWANHPELTADPITGWQIWNEPDLPRANNAACPGVSLGTYWPRHAGEKYSGTGHSRKDLLWAPTMVDLVRKSRTAIRAVDPKAKVMFPSLTGKSWDSLTLAYLAGGKGAFDRIGINLFTSLSNFSPAFAAKILPVLKKYKDTGSQISLTEYSWTTAQGKVAMPSLPFSITTESGQKAKVAAALAALSKNRTRWKLAATQWYTWATDDPASSHNIFDYAGLSAFNDATGAVRRKPGLGAFTTEAMLLEGCKTKLVATSCATK